MIKIKPSLKNTNLHTEKGMQLLEQSIEKAGVLEMSNIVTDMVKKGLTGEEIMSRLMMEKEEVVRLLFRAGIPKSDVFKDKDFSKSWTPE
jgi:hypothetical protein